VFLLAALAVRISLTVHSLSRRRRRYCDKREHVASGHRPNHAAPRWQRDLITTTGNIEAFWRQSTSHEPCVAFDVELLISFRRCSLLAVTATVTEVW